MKKSIRNMIAALLVLAMFTCCFVACDNGESEDTTPATAVTIVVYDANGEIFMRGKDFAVTEGDTVRAVVDAFVASRNGCSCAYDASGMFSSFKVEDGTELKSYSKNNSDGTASVYYFTWSINDTAKEIDNPELTTVKNGDTISITLKLDASVKPKD